MLKDILETLKAVKNRRELTHELTRLRKLVYYDELTGVLNRRGFKEEAERAFSVVSYPRKQAERRAKFSIPFSVLFIDADHFKKINDRFGHAVGDKVLKKIAVILKHNLRTKDIIGRWGGEEFVVVLLGTRADIAKTVAERIRWDVQRTKFPLGGKPFYLTVSIGISQHNGERNLMELIHNADEAMYQAKKKGRNRVIEFK